MPLVPLEECEICGSRDIRQEPEEDRSVGYYALVWVCHNGHNVEAFRHEIGGEMEDF